MSRVILIASQKGGAGKTTTALNLGYSLGRLGERVLLVDADPQGGLADSSNMRSKSQGGLVDVLRQTKSASQVIITTRDQTLAAVGVGAETHDDVLYFEKEAHRGNVGALIREISEHYSYTIVDAPAGVGGLVAALLVASTSVVVTLASQPLAVRGLPSFLRLFKRVVAQANPSLRLDGVLVTMHNTANEIENSMLQHLQGGLPLGALLSSIIPFDEAFTRASLKSVPIAMVANAKGPASAYMELAMELKMRDLQRGMTETDDERVMGLF